MRTELLQVASFNDDGLYLIEAVIVSQPVNERVGGGILGPSPIDRVFQTVHLNDVSIFDQRTGEMISCSEIPMKVSASRGQVIGVMPGDRCRTRARILSTREVTNPGCEHRVLSRPVLMVEHPSMIDVIDRDECFKKNLFVEMHDAWKSTVLVSLVSSIDWFADTDEVRLISSIVLGERGSEFESLSQPFRRTGTAHYLAVSGFAIGVIAGVPVFLLRGHGRIFQAFTTSFFLIVGMLAIDLRAPAVRSGVIIMMATLGLSMGREWSRIGLLSLILIVILMENLRRCITIIMAKNTS